jgi:hypothetical protein
MIKVKKVYGQDAYSTGLQNSHNTAPIAEAQSLGALLWPAAEEHKAEKPEPAGANTAFFYIAEKGWPADMPNQAPYGKVPKAFRGVSCNSTQKNCKEFKFVAFSNPACKGTVHNINQLDGILVQINLNTPRTNPQKVTSLCGDLLALALKPTRQTANELTKDLLKH